MHRVHCKLWRHINPSACNACNYCWTVGHQTGYNQMLDPVLCVVRSFQERIFKDGAMEPCGKRLAKRCTRGDQNPKWLLRNRQWSVAAFPMQTCCLVPRRNARTGLQTAEEVGVWGVEVCRILLCGPPAISSSAVSSIHVSYFQYVSIMGGQSPRTRTNSFRSETTNQFRFCSWCPAGAGIAARKQTPRNDSAGTCAGGLKGEPCSFCPDGKSWAGDKCADCGAAAVGWAAAVSLALIGVRTAYFYTNSAAAWHLRCCSKRGSFKRFCYSLWVFWKLWTSMMKAPKTPSLARNCFCEPKTGKGHVAKLEIETQRASSFIPPLPGEGWNCRFHVSCPVSSSAAPQLQALDRSVPRWTQTASSGSQCSPPECQKECQKICQIHMPERMSDRMSEYMPERGMSEPCHNSV